MWPGRCLMFLPPCFPPTWWTVPWDGDPKISPSSIILFLDRYLVITMRKVTNIPSLSTILLLLTTRKAYQVKMKDSNHFLCWGKDWKSMWAHCHLSSESHLGDVCKSCQTSTLESNFWNDANRRSNLTCICISDSMRTCLTKRQDRSRWILPDTMGDSFQKFTLGFSNSPKYIKVNIKQIGLRL